MKTQILSRRNTPISVIGFLLLVATTLLGCGVLFNVNRVRRLDPVVLTEDDLPMMRLTGSDHLREFPKESSFIVGFQQRWNYGHLIVRYYLFDSSSSAKKARTNPWGRIYALVPNFHPEPNPEDVIGDATWHNTHRRQGEREKGFTDIYFVKNNVGVLVSTRGTLEYGLQFARDISRKIEAKIVAVLKKK